MLGEKISSLRKERHMSQVDLGNEVGVTYQAVSKWERNVSMPDFDMISKLAKFFDVPISYFEEEADNEDDVDISTDTDAENVQNADSHTDHLLGMCTVCGKYVFESNAAEQSPKLVCQNCHNAQVEQNKREKAVKEQERQSKDSALSARFNKRSTIAVCVAGVISVAVFILLLVNMSKWSGIFGTGAYIATAIAGLLLMFMWIFQLFFDGIVREITLSGLFFIKLPGIIFSADLDGLIFLVVMKILFFIISAVVFIGAMIVTSFVAMIVSLFTFIPVIRKIIHRKEDIL
ncbi:MAG: helix-turn-helix domain-containing protein [Corallococcus sp.]|nr:helix-turn-helix domain-containing protein [Bacillota bacterium]MCM1534174.1 helix-turn-helix domain-containing protein [Corallococcus sp.]